MSWMSTVAMAFQTLGVVYGDMGTSPLYVFSDVFSKVPIKSEVEILGALSLVMYTIALIPFAKYVFIVLKANDNGEGEMHKLAAMVQSVTAIRCRLCVLLFNLVWLNGCISHGLQAARLHYIR
jgi:K+ transporter